jgi:hypothetical protein
MQQAVEQEPAAIEAITHSRFWVDGKSMTVSRDRSIWQRARPH